MSRLDTLDERQLIIELMNGDEKAFSELFHKYRSSVYSYSFTMLKTKELAEEVLQDVFLSIWQHRERLNPDLSFKSYVFTITRNYTFNLIKKVATNNKLREDVFYKSQKSHCTTEDDMILAEYEIAKKTAIGQLPPKRKIIFEMSRNEEKSYNEISKELNISVNTVKVQMSKALASIRYFLQTESDITLLVAFFFM